MLLVEAGGGHRVRPWVNIPVGYLHAIGNKHTDWRFRTHPEPACVACVSVCCMDALLVGCTKLARAGLAGGRCCIRGGSGSADAGMIYSRAAA